ncbi:MAG TPA: phage replisome organizer N-terminal domain-containing protein, partial [Spirochaetota bacterium]|nr:phage replisome organizer N-terminal domain-containing protein [Spirochaetota bacterium]
MENKKYWLKLQKDFLKSTHIRVIKNMPNGKDYIIFYLALMLESIEYVGHLRFSDLVPYNEEMLASITETNVDIVRSAVKIFTQLGLMEYLDDGTIYMTQVAQMIGKESDSAERVRQYRLRQQDQKALQCNNEVTNSNDIKRKKEDIDIKKEDIDIKKEDIDNLKTTTIDIYSNIEANFGRPLSPMEYEKISNWLSL